MRPPWPRLVLLAASLASGAAGGQPADGAARIGIAEADAYVTVVFAAQDSARYDTGAEAYLSMLARLGAPVSEPEAATLARHLRQLAPVVPGAERVAWGLDDALRRGALARLAPGVGARIVRWWRSQDDLPATPSNERLGEHLARVAHALRAYAAPDDPRGYDDRGEVYVRLGPPDRVAEIAIDAGIVAFDLRGRSPIGRLPDNAFWVYDRVHASAQYVFVREARRGPYRLGGGLDLLPRALRRASRGLRGDAEAEAFLTVMEAVYGQLAVRHPAYGAPYDALSISNGSGIVRDDPGYVALRVVAQAQAADAVAEAVRRESVPASVSTTHAGTEPLRASARWARFREPDGTTRLDVSWAVEEGALRPSPRLVRRLERQGRAPSDSVLLSASAAVLTDDFEPRATVHDHRPLAEGDGAAGTLAVPLRATPARLALQWQTRRPVPDAPRLLVGTLRPADPLVPLRAGGLEMSDLRPLTGPADALRPHPFASLPADGRLALYVEVYGLVPNAAGRTRYTVEYRVVGHADGRETSARVTYDGSDATVQEAVALDVAPWLGEAVRIGVRVRDETAGLEVERSISFDAPR